MDWTELVNQLSDVAVIALGGALSALITLLGLYARSWLRTQIAKQDNEFLNIVAHQAARAAEQMFGVAAGEEKLSWATAMVVQRAEAAGITVNPTHVRTLIEGAVHDLNALFVLSDDEEG